MVFSITRGEITLRLHLRNGVLVYLDESTQGTDFAVNMNRNTFIDCYLCWTQQIKALIL